MKKILKYVIIFTTFTILGIIIFLFVNASKTRETIPYTGKTNSNNNPTFSVNLSTNQTNELINFYLEDYQKNSDIKYTFYLENVALIKGDFEFLGTKMKLYFYLEPKVLDNGNVELEVISISLGTLELPRKQILNYITNNYKIPNWVEIKEDKIIMNLDRFKLKNDIYFSAKKIDLINKEIEMNVFLPN